MKDKDVKVGMKVVPHSKTVWGYKNIEQYMEEGTYGEFLKENGYLYVTGFEDGFGWTLNEKLYLSDGGDFFKASDFEPYEEPKILLSNKPKIIDIDGQKVKIIRHANATIVILEDGRKGIAKCDPADEYDTDFVLLAYKRALSVKKNNN